MIKTPAAVLRCDRYGCRMNAMCEDDVKKNGRRTVVASPRRRPLTTSPPRTYSEVLAFSLRRS